MRTPKTLFFALAALYVTGAQALPPQWTAICTEWNREGVQLYNDGCAVMAKSDAPGSADVIAEIHGRPLWEVSFNPNQCTFNGQPCVRVNPYRPDGVQYRMQDGRGFEFTVPKD